jgi:hypothetical protein
LKLDKSIDKLSKRIERIDPSPADDDDGNNNVITHWKGKPIIPLAEWDRIEYTSYVLNFYPDDFHGVLTLPSDADQSDRINTKKWNSNYAELMEYRKNPNYGMTKCAHCLLSPEREDAALFFGIHKLIAKGLQEDDYKDESDDDKIYSCKILNRYQCPYDNYKQKVKENAKFDVSDLFALEKMAFAIELAFAKAYSMTESNEKVYEADFEAGKVTEICTNYYGEPQPSQLEEPLEEKLAEVKKLSQVPIRNVQDVRHALTNKETLNKLLIQGLNEEYQKHKDELLDLLMSIKDKVRIEDLDIHEPIWTSDREKAKCSSCQEFANIKCINCRNVWLCIDHWREHKLNSQHM